MGSCASNNIHERSTKCITIQNNGTTAGKDDGNGQRAVCEIHEKTLTHYNAKSKQLYCFTCYQDYKRCQTTEEAAQVHEITEFLETSEKQTLEKLRNSQHTTKHQLLQISRIREKLKNKRRQFMDEIKHFVNTVIDLIKHLEEEICQETNHKIHAAVNELEDRQSRLDTQLETIETLKSEKDKSSVGNTAERLKTVVKCKHFLKTTIDFKDHITDYEATLKLNKNISLNDIIGKKGNSLGYVTCDSITEDESDDTTYTERSTTQQTNSTSGANSSQLNTGDLGENKSILVNKIPIQNTSASERGHNDELRLESKSVVNQDNTNSVQEKERNAFDNVYDKREHPCDNNTGQLQRSQANGRVSQVQERFDESQNRQQVHRGNAISRHVPSYSGTPNRNTQTPRRSTQSTVSPGNITTPMFTSPRPKQHLESMERRIVEKIQEIKLPSGKEIPNITDTTQLRDGNIVLCDQKNEKLLLMSRDFHIIDKIKLSGHPHNVSSVPGSSNRIAVTIPDENAIKIVDVIEDAFDEKIEVIKLQSKPKCRGIEYADDNLIYTTRNDVYVLRNDERTIRKFKNTFRQPVSLWADRSNDVIFVSCVGLQSFGEVVKMHHKDEKIDFVISCDEIKHPVCSTSDREGYIYICGINPPSVHQVSPDGEYCQRLLSDSQGHFQHVNFLEGTDMFIATMNDSDDVHIYEMKYPLHAWKSDVC